MNVIEITPVSFWTEQLSLDQHNQRTEHKDKIPMFGLF